MKTLIAYIRPLNEKGIVTKKDTELIIGVSLFNRQKEISKHIDSLSDFKDHLKSIQSKLSKRYEVLVITEAQTKYFNSSVIGNKFNEALNFATTKQVYNMFVI